MKPCHLFKHSLVLLCFLFLSPEAIRSQTVLFPKSNDTLYAGASYLLKYEGFNKEHKKLLIELYQGKKLITAIETVRNRKSFLWVVPNNIRTNTSYGIKISSTVDINYHCYSEPFFLHKPVITLQRPAANEVWVASGSNYAVKWTQKGNAGEHVIIDLFRRGNTVWKSGIKTINDSSFTISFSDSLKVKTDTGYTVRITSVNDTSIYATSQPFTINNPSYNYLSLLDIPLVWMPSESKSLTGQFPAQYVQVRHFCFAVLTFKDMRKDTTLVGENLEHSNSIRRVTVNESVSEWSRENLTFLMIKNGICANTHSYDFGIVGDIERFYIEETSTYNAEIAITFYLVTSRGSPVWSKRITAKADNWGSSYSAVNYFECITDAYINLFESLFTDISFKNTLKEQRSSQINKQ